MKAVRNSFAKSETVVHFGASMDGSFPRGCPPMKKLMRSCVVAAATCLQMAVCQSAVAQASAVPSGTPIRENVQALLNSCNAPDTSSDYAFCVGYVGGIGDIMRTSGIMLKSLYELKQLDKNTSTAKVLTVVSICSSVPETVITHDAMVQAFKNWANRHPKNWGMNIPFSVGDALRETWPCAPKSP